MKFTQLFLAVFFCFFSFLAFSSSKKIDVIYGDDNRVDVFESKDSVLVELSRSTAAMIHQNSLTRKEDEFILEGKSLKSRGVCENEKFSHQSTAAQCSGFLISENLFVTAGHCIKSQADCENYRWVFDYKVENESQGQVTVSKNNVYSCRKILSRSLDNSSKDDFALIELDRPVSDRRPLSYRRFGKISKGEEIVVIGHPSGLPTKIADGAKVRSLQEKFFVANLDTYGGNSGSAVFNLNTHEVEGILVRGDTDYIFDSSKGCQVSNRCSDSGCRGEDVTYINNIPELN